MAKTQQTLEIEQTLERVCRERRIYGCKEVTIGFPNNHMGREICDFVTMDSYGILRCYEIKVSFSDLQSSAKMSWYGHYNYLVIPESMVEKITDYVHKIPDFVGILVANDGQLSSLRKAKIQNISEYREQNLRESMIRSLSFKMEAYRSLADGRTGAKLRKELRETKKNYEKEKELELLYYTRYMDLRSIVRGYKEKTGIDIEKEMEKNESGECRSQLQVRKKGRPEGDLFSTCISCA